MKKICLTGGGTGGHIIPNIAIFESGKEDFKFFYIGAKNSMEEKLITPLMPFFSAPMIKLVRAFTLKNFKIPFVLAKSIIECKKILKREKPDAIFSKGGFVSVPVCIAGFMLKIPIITHESDLTLGLGNKVISKMAKAVCTSFEETSKTLKKGVYTGSPIRKSFKNANKLNAIKQIKKYDASKKTIVIVGGSLGSKNLNNAIQNSLTLLKNYNVVHIVGKNNLVNTINKTNYTQFEYVQNIADFFDLADIVITRGGSNALFEILYMNKKMIIVPLGKAQSRGDQLENSKVFKENGWASVLPEEELTPNTLKNKIENILSGQNGHNSTILNKNRQNTTIYNTKNRQNMTIYNGCENILKVIKKYIKY